MKHALRMTALGSLLSVTAMTAPLMMGMTFTGTQDQDRSEHQEHTQSHPEYSNNQYYRLGNREGYVDHERKSQRKEHQHKYRKDEDRKAHDYGYQQGWQGQSYHSNHDHDDHR